MYKVDIIIPTYRPDKTFELLLDRLSIQTYPIQKILIMNTKSDTFPMGKCSSVSNLEVHHIEKSEFDHGGTRHAAAELSDADIMVFMTQDAVPEDDKLIESLVKPFAKDNIAVSYARQLPNADCRLIERYTRGFNYPGKSVMKGKADLDTMGIKTFFCSNVCAAYRRDVYIQQGGFERHTIFNEDMIFAGKLVKEGWQIAYAARARAVHSHNYGVIEQFKRNFDLAVSQKQHPEVFGGIKSETEGVRLVKDTVSYLIRIRKPWLIVQLILQSGFKYLGYLCGSRYEKMPDWLRVKCSLNPMFWKRQA